MAKVIVFFPKQLYMGGGTASYTHLSEIYELSEENEINLELRCYAADPYDTAITGSLVTTSDPTFQDVAWKVVSGTFTRAGSGITTITDLSGFGKFVRAKLEVPQQKYVFISLNAVARKQT
jgi:hypothetical protein